MLGGKKKKFPSLMLVNLEHYDDLAALLDAVKRINVILVDLCRDVWAYVSLEYFKQKIAEKEIGSSAMPHKVHKSFFTAT